MSRVHSLFLLTPLFILLCSCAHYRMDNADYAGPEPLPDEIDRLYSYEKHPLNFTEKIVKESNKYTLKKVTLLLPPKIATSKIDFIEIDYYDVKEPRVAPVILVLPILDGNNRISNFYAKYFANHGYAALIVNRNAKLLQAESVEEVEAALKQNVIDLKQVLDWIETRNDLDRNNIGVFGISLGAINSALIIALDRRIKAAVMGLAGGDLPYILTNSSENSVQKGIARIKEKNNLSDEPLYCELRCKIQTDPLKYAKYIDARKVLVVVALLDTVIPTKKGKALITAIGMPQPIYILSGHYTAIFYIFYTRSKSLSFFNERLR